MKRRSRVNLKDPPIIRNFSSRGITGVRRSDNRFDTTTSSENEDMNRVKRVKFQDPGTDKLPNCRPDASSIRNEATPSPRSDVPKTSEYAFFKKLKKNASGHSYPLQKNDNQLKDVELSECTNEIFYMPKQRYKDLRSSLPMKRARPINNESFLSPSAGVSKNSDRSSKGIRSPLLIQKVMPMSHYFSSSPFDGGSKNSGNQYSDKGVFSTRRQRLRQWVATSFPELDESCSVGVDLVDVLLSRLFPGDIENNCRLDPRSRQVQTDTKHQLPSCSASDTHVKGLNSICTRNLMESGHGSYWDDGLSRYRSDRPGDIVIPELDAVGSEYPSSFYTTKTHLQYKYREPLCDSNVGRIASSCTESDPFFVLPYPKHGLAHLKELDEFHGPNRPALGGEPHTLLLGWDFNNEKEELDPSIMSHNTEINLFSALTTSSRYPQNVRDRLNASTPCSSSFVSLNSFRTHHFGRYLQHENYQNSELDQFPLTISHNPKYLKLVEDRTSDNTPEGSSIILSPQDHTWYTNRVHRDMHHPSFESLLPSGLDFGLGLKCLSMVDSNYHPFQFPHNEGVCRYLLENEKESCLYNSDHANGICEGTLNHHDWPVISFPISCDEEVDHPLLLGNSSWATSQDEIYCNDDGDDDEWRYI